MITKRSLVAILLLILLAGCSGGGSTFELENIPILGNLVQGTKTNTPVPSPTATPTPLPEARLDEAERLLSINGDYDRALAEYQLAFSQAANEDTRLSAQIGMARIYFEQGDQSQSLFLLRSILEGYPDNPRRADAYYFLGQIYSELGRYAEAAGAYDDFLKLRPGEIDSRIAELKADALFTGGDFIGAINAFQVAIQSPHLGNNDQLNVKLADAYRESGNADIAIQVYQQVFDSTANEFTKAQMDFLIGQTYYRQGNYPAAYERFQHAVANYPKSYDTYSGLVTLVIDNQVVDELQRGLVDYYAGKFSQAVEALDRYMNSNPDHDGTPLFFKGLALRAIGEQNYPLFSDLRSESLYNGQGIPEDNQAIAAWQKIIDEHFGDPYWADAFDEIAYTQWAYQERPGTAADTMLRFVSQQPGDEHAPAFLYMAARYLERANLLADAATSWERMADLYPSYQDTFRALILAGISRYRLAEYESAEASFQRAFVLASSPYEQSAAYLWIGKCQSIRGNPEAAAQSWLQAATRDPTGYYSERARELSLGQSVFTPASLVDMAIDLPTEKLAAETWMRSTFSISEDVSLDQPGDLQLDQRHIRGMAYHSLGLYEQAKTEFDNLREEIKNDPIRTFRFIQEMLDLGYYSQAILASRQVLTLATMNDLDTLSAPIFFNHIRFGLYYKDLILPLAQETGLDPLLLFSMVRQESLFNGHAESVVGARGLMQLMPATGAETASYIGWPSGYSAKDLDRPMVNLRLGASYLERQMKYFDGNIFAALAAYNAGAGNSSIWASMAQDDPDLLLEIIRYSETSQYIQYIFENFSLYVRFYGRGL